MTNNQSINGKLKHLKKMRVFFPFFWGVGGRSMEYYGMNRKKCPSVVALSSNLDNSQG